MRLGIIGNTNKENLKDIISLLVNKLNEKRISYSFDESLKPFVEKTELMNIEKLAENSDILISIGGDGTMLSTAFYAHLYSKPVVGLNIGKLGFLAEIDVQNIEGFIDDIMNHNYKIENRTVLKGRSKNGKCKNIIAFNDIVIDKGNWPKMNQITIYIDNEYVATFSADGLIIATPTGSTGYSLSVGGPIISPNSNVITLSPISPHTLSMRPLVIPSNQRISIQVESHSKKIQVNCDGQRVQDYIPPVELDIVTDPNPLKLLRTNSTSYFEILRTKLLWGIDLRQNQSNIRSN